MNERKLRQLFKSAQSEPVPEPDPDFERRVMRLLRAEGPRHSFSIADQLNELFPRLALAALLVMALCVAGDFCAVRFGQLDLASGISRISEQWLFATQAF